MRWFREWRAWVQWKRDEDERKLRDRVLSELKRIYPAVGTFDGYFADFLITTVREHDRRDERHWNMA